MTVSVVEVKTGEQLKAWVKFPLDLYRGDPNYVPQLIREEIDFFSAGSNPSFQVADTRLLLALKNGSVVGRICGLIHRLETEKLGYPRGRFGWFETHEDPEIARAMLGHLEDWFVREKCDEITGPHGFTDLDPEGLLIDGFEQLPTIAGSYNKPYYRAFIESCGFEKQVDYIEHRIVLPQEPPSLFKLMQKRVAAAEKEGYRVVPCRSKKQMLAYLEQFWQVLEAAFADLFGVTPLTKAQMQYYTKKYFGFIDPSFVQMVVNEANRLQGFFLGLPSLSRPFQKARGRLLPFGFYHIWRGFRRYDTVDFYFAGIDPQANARKVFPILVHYMYQALKARGVTYLETNRELEDNSNITRIWTKFQVVNRRRSRIFRKRPLRRESA
jgi:hypothetical protein